MADGDVVVVAAGRELSGWTAIRVSRGIERCPNDFEVVMTEKSASGDKMTAQPGDDCELRIGDDLVITGFIDVFSPSISPRGHEIRLAGRGKCQDLVDCAAEWPNGQITGATVKGIAEKLAGVYGITVTASGDVGASIPQFNLILGETAYEIIERIARYRGILVYEDETGNLVLGPVGTDKHASGFMQGGNVQSANFTADMSQRFSEYQALLQSTDVLGDTGDAGNLLFTANDPRVNRHRRHITIAEAGGGGQDVAKQRALWEAARRAGRGNRLSIACDSWRDSAGKLWTPNMLASFSLPALKVADDDWIIGEVTYLRDDRGTRAELLLMPPAAFQPEPVLLQPYPADIPATPQ